MSSEARILSLRAVATWPPSCRGLPRCPGIYKIVCGPTGETYIGSSVVLSVRWLWHQKHLNEGTHTNPRLLRAFRRWGGGRFYFQVLELWPKGVSNKKLEEREQFWMDRQDKLINIIKAGGSRPSNHRPMWKTARKITLRRRS